MKKIFFVLSLLSFTPLSVSALSHYHSHSSMAYYPREIASANPDLYVQQFYDHGKKLVTKVCNRGRNTIYNDEIMWQIASENSPAYQGYPPIRLRPNQCRDFFTNPHHFPVRNIGYQRTKLTSQPIHICHYYETGLNPNLIHQNHSPYHTENKRLKGPCCKTVYNPHHQGRKKSRPAYRNIYESYNPFKHRHYANPGCGR